MLEKLFVANAGKETTTNDETTPAVSVGSATCSWLGAPLEFEICLPEKDDTPTDGETSGEEVATAELVALGTTFVRQTKTNHGEKHCTREEVSFVCV